MIRNEGPELGYYEEGKCLNIYWKIKNLTYGWNSIRSPEFTISGSKCYLELDSETVECKVVCLNEKHFSVPLISFLKCDGSEENSDQCGPFLRVSKERIFGQEQSEFLPEDTLTVRCRFPTDTERGKILIFTRIAINNRSFLWTLKKLRDEECNRTICIENSDQYGEIQLNLKPFGDNGDQQLCIEISRRGGQKCRCFLRIIVLDADGNAVNYMDGECIFEKEEGKQFQRFPPVIDNGVLSCKNLFLPDDTLSLKCNFIVTLGTVSEQTAVFSYGDDITSLIKKSDDISMHFKDGIFYDSTNDLKADLERCVLNCWKPFDVCLQVGSDIIKAHKSVLCASSAVFNGRFSMDTLGEPASPLAVDGFDVDTVRMLLFFMYTLTVYVYRWENIMRLYAAADKYEVLSLKNKCSCYLGGNLSLSNVCEVLVLACQYEDANLTTVVLDFVSKHSSEVFASKAWENLEKSRPSLALKTLKEICSNKN